MPSQLLQYRPESKRSCGEQLPSQEYLAGETDKYDMTVYRYLVQIQRLSSEAYLASQTDKYNTTVYRCLVQTSG